MKLKAFFIIFERLSLKQIKKFFLEGESPTLIPAISLSTSFREQSMNTKPILRLLWDESHASEYYGIANTFSSELVPLLNYVRKKTFRKYCYFQLANYF